MDGYVEGFLERTCTDPEHAYSVLGPVRARLLVDAVSTMKRKHRYTTNSRRLVELGVGCVEDGQGTFESFLRIIAGMRDGLWDDSVKPTVESVKACSDIPMDFMNENAHAGLGVDGLSQGQTIGEYEAEVRRLRTRLDGLGLAYGDGSWLVGTMSDTERMSRRQRSRCMLIIRRLNAIPDRDLSLLDLSVSPLKRDGGKEDRYSTWLVEDMNRILSKGVDGLYRWTLYLCMFRRLLGDDTAVPETWGNYVVEARSLHGLRSMVVRGRHLWLSEEGVPDVECMTSLPVTWSGALSVMRSMGLDMDCGSRPVERMYITRADGRG